MKKGVKKEISVADELSRRFVNLLGLLEPHLSAKDISLSEIRALKEIEKAGACSSEDLLETLRISSECLSQILKQLEKKCLVEKKSTSGKSGQPLFYLTPKGGGKTAEINARLDGLISDPLSPLPEADRFRLAQNIASIENILTRGKNIKSEDIAVRHDIRPGDIGGIIRMHGRIYREEYNYTTAFEAYVANSFYEFLINYDAARDRLWIAEHNNEIIGSIGIVGRGDRAQLRWFLLYPGYRGIGLGKRLLSEAIAYCREKGWKSVYLDTTDDLDKAIGMYTKAGFVKVSEKENHTWSDDLMELEFELSLEQRA